MPYQATHLRDWAYANGNLGKSALASTIDVFALFYLTTVLQLPSATAGVIILLSLIYDAFTDPLIGYFADRQHQERHTALPYYAIGVPLASISFLAFFSSHYLSPDIRVYFATASLLAFRVGYALVDVPHNGLLVQIAVTRSAKTSISGMRIFCSSLGKFSATALAAVFLSHQSSIGQPKTFIQLATCVIFVFVGSMVISGLAIRGVKLYAQGLSAGPPKFIAIVSSLGKAKKLRTVFYLTAANSIAIPGIAISFVYTSRYVLGDASLGAQAVLAQAVGQGASLVGWRFLAHKLGEQNRTLTLAYALLAVIAGLGFFGFFSNLKMQAIAAVSGFAIGGIFMLNWAMLPEAIEEARHHSKSSALLSYFGFYTIINKSMHGLAQAGIGFALIAAGFQADVGLTTGGAKTLQQLIFGVVFLFAVICGIQLTRLRADMPTNMDQK